MYPHCKTIIKRLFLSLIMFFFTNNLSRAQSFLLHHPLNEPLLINPALSNAFECNRANLNYKKHTAYDFSSLSVSAKAPRHNISGSVLISNLLQGKSINSLSIKGIFSKSIQLKARRQLHFAFEASYFQQNIQQENLIFRHMLNPADGSYTAYSGIYNFAPVYRHDFALGVAYFSPAMRGGIALQNIAALYNYDSRLPFHTLINIHFGRSFDLSNTRNDEKKIIIPEIFVQYRPGSIRFVYGASVFINNISGSIFLKQNISRKSYEPAFSIRLHHQSLIFRYSYEISVNEYFMQAINSHSAGLIYNFACDNKRNRKNTIFCEGF